MFLRRYSLFPVTRFLRPMRKFTASERKTREFCLSYLTRGEFCESSLGKDKMHKYPGACPSCALYCGYAEARPMIPFPGKKARFEVACSWQSVDQKTSTSTPLCMSMMLTSATPGSLLHEIGAFGYRDGSIVLRVTCARDEEDRFKKYVSDAGFEPHVPARDFYARTPTEQKWLLSVLADQEVPQEEFVRMKSFMKANRWARL